MNNSIELDTAITPAIAPDDYGRVLRGLKLTSISLLDCAAKCKPEAARDAFTGGKPMPVDIAENAAFSSSDGTVSVQHGYMLKSRAGKNVFVSVRAVYILTFKSSEEFTGDFFNVFQDLALPMFTWPYFRELVGSMTSRMELPTLHLGLRHGPPL